MGDYINNRLFCIGEIFFIQLVSDGSYHRLSMSGVRTYQGGIPTAPAGFFRGFSDTSVYLSDYRLSGNLWMEPLYQKTEDGSMSEIFVHIAFYQYDFILYLENVMLFSRGTADELLWKKFVLVS